MADEPWLKYQSSGADAPWAKYQQGAAATPARDTEAPGPWPGVTSPETKASTTSQPSAIGHIARAMGSAFAPPYGPSDEVLKPFHLDSYTNPLGLLARDALTTVDVLGRPVASLLKGASAGMGEFAKATGGSQEEAERDTALLGDVAATIMGQSPMSGVPKAPRPAPLSGVGRINASDQAKQTIGAGFVLPPAEASQGHIGEVNAANMAAGEAGKIKLGQLAAAKNQPLVNVYARTDLGLPAETVLSPQMFKAVRDREGQVYQQVVSAVPEIDLGRDEAFHDAVAKVGARSAETEKMFPSTKEPPGIPALRAELLHNSRAPTQTVMDYIADLRKNATANFQKDGDAMAHRMGAAQREAAHVLEDAMERSVENAPDYYRTKVRDAQEYRDSVYRERADQGLPIQGPVVEDADRAVVDWSRRLEESNARNQDNQTLLDRFRQARQTMAKSYDVEAVTNVSTGDVSAAGLGKLLQQGKPLTGNLKLIADSANSFHRAFQNPASFGGVESYSVLDAAGAAAMALSGHPVAATLVGARPLIRGHVLSPRFQRRMISQPEPSPIPSVVGPLGRVGAGVAGAQGLTSPETPANARALGAPP